MPYVVCMISIPLFCLKSYIRDPPKQDEIYHHFGNPKDHLAISGVGKRVTFWFGGETSLSSKTLRKKTSFFEICYLPFNTLHGLAVYNICM